MSEVKKRIEYLSREKLALLSKKMKERAVKGPQHKIERRPNPFAPCQLSFAQQRLWFLDQLMPNNPFYNVPGAVRLNGRLDLETLERVIDEIVRRHEVLRTRFEVEGGEPVQVIDEWEPRRLDVENLMSLSPEEKEEEVRRITREEAETGFDLKRGPLLRVKVLKLEEEEHVMLYTMHHIVSDGWSTEILTREVGAIYRAYSAGEPSPLPELPIQYADFAVWQRAWLQGEVLEKELKYWRKQLAGGGTLELPADHPRPAVRSYREASRCFVVERELAERLRALCQREGVTLFMTLLGGFDVLMSRYSGQKDVVVGTDIANRNRAEIEGLIGFFVNQLVMRVEVRPGESFRELLMRVREVCLGAYAHQDVPFEKLVEELQPDREPGRSPLFQAKLIFENAQREVLELEGMRLSSGKLQMTSEVQTAKFDLTVAITDAGRDLIGSVSYSRDLFEEETVERLISHYTNALRGAVEDIERPISELRLLSESEREQIIVEWNETTRSYPQARCIHELFREQARQRPEGVAVSCDQEQISYRELNQRANQLAHYLRELGVGPEVRVGICLERSIQMVVGLLGILKAGGAYVPLDPTYPDERLNMIAEDAEVRLLLIGGQLAQRFSNRSVNLICLDRDWKTISTRSPEELQAEVEPDNASYVIYTSGSTGRPKGVIVTHRSVHNLFNAVDENLHFSQDDIWTMFHSFSFDFSVWEIWGALAYGGRLVVVPQLVARTPEEFCNLVHQEGVTILSQTPSAFLHFIKESELVGVDRDTSLRAVVFGGEALEFSSLKVWIERYGDELPQLINMYGITETTVHTTHKRVTSEEVKKPCGSLIGRPLPNVRMYVLDEQMEPVPVGVIGELYVGGAGVARGYLGREDLTADRFMPAPYGKESGERIYKAGDLARYRKDGNVEYLGRRDHQVKVRGFRIELGEIEVQLSSHPGVRQCVVMADVADTGEKGLGAYVLCEGENAPGVGELRSYLKERLPEYMVPTWFVWLDQMPLTPNGKVDRRALAAIEAKRSEGRAGYIAPRTPVEGILVGIFEEVLKLDRVGIDDDFFEIGGHSLLATQVISRVRNTFEVDVEVRSIFEASTVAKLAEVMIAREPTPGQTEKIALILSKLNSMTDEDASVELASIER